MRSREEQGSREYKPGLKNTRRTGRIDEVMMQQVVVEEETKCSEAERKDAERSGLTVFYFMFLGPVS